MSKLHVETAFRNVPGREEDCHLPRYKWSNESYYYVVLAFGLRWAPFTFDKFAVALEWIARKCIACEWFLHYLDDFFVCGRPGTDECKRAINKAVSACRYLGVSLNLRNLASERLRQSACES